MSAITDLPMFYDLDADYAPQYVKLARIIRDQIPAGHYKHGDQIPAATLTNEHHVSRRVACHALAALAASRYVNLPGRFTPYTVTWQATP